MRISDWSSDVCSSDLPERVVPQRVAFTGTAEQPRTDYFIAGTGQTRIATAPATARRPHITNPVSGSVHAIDTDLPIDLPRLAIGVSGVVTAHRLTLTGRGWGAAAQIGGEAGGETECQAK